MRKKVFFSPLIVILLVLAVWEVQVYGAEIVIKVNCTKGETITNALQKFIGNPITIEVNGSCTENVTINRDDVTLIKHISGGAVNGIATNNAAIVVMGDRAVIDGLTVTGAGGGFRVQGNSTMIQNCIVHDVVFNGIGFPGGSGTVDTCMIQNNGMHGVNISNAGSATVTNTTIGGSGIHGLNISGGGRATVTNSTISSNTERGILVYNGGIGYVDNCTIQNNGDDGILIEAANGTVINSMISSNGGAGVLVSRGGSAKIGMNGGGAKYPNTINNNQSSGIHIYAGGSAFILGNTIDGNGTGPNIIHGQSGILVAGATASLFGGNTITNNRVNGIQAVGSSVFFVGEGSVPDVISGNYNAGIVGLLGSSFEIYYATINGNNGNGVNLNLRSTAIITGGTISNNTEHGIRLVNGAGLVFVNPAVTVTGNAWFGLQCLDAESSYFSSSGDISGISGNIEGNVSKTCTGFDK